MSSSIQIESHRYGPSSYTLHRPIFHLLSAYPEDDDAYRHCWMSEGKCNNPSPSVTPNATRLKKGELRVKGSKYKRRPNNILFKVYLNFCLYPSPMSPRIYSTDAKPDLKENIPVPVRLSIYSIIRTECDAPRPIAGLPSQPFGSADGLLTT